MRTKTNKTPNKTKKLKTKKNFFYRFGDFICKNVIHYTTVVKAVKYYKKQ